MRNVFTTIGQMIMQILLSRCTSPKYAYMARLIDKPQALVR